MLTGKIIVRAATPADVRDYFGQNSPQTVRAKVLEADGEVMGIAGYYLSGGVAIVFSDNKPGIPKMTIWRQSVALMNSLTIPALCVASEGSERFLERLGWARVGPTDAGVIYQWQH